MIRQIRKHQISVDVADPGDREINSNNTPSKKSNQINLSIWDKQSEAMRKTGLLVLFRG